MKPACLALPAFAALCFTLPTAHAQAVYKCSSPEGATTYQSIPCSEGETSLRRYATPSTSNPTQALSAAPVGPGQRRAQVRHTTTVANESCEGAKASRAAALRAAGSRVTADMRASLDQQVKATCQ